MASPTEQTIKQEPLPSSSLGSEQLKAINQAFTVPKIEDDETFEKFYSEVIYSQLRINLIFEYK